MFKSSVVIALGLAVFSASAFAMTPAEAQTALAARFGLPGAGKKFLIGTSGARGKACLVQIEAADGSTMVSVLKDNDKDAIFYFRVGDFPDQIVKSSFKPERLEVQAERPEGHMGSPEGDFAGALLGLEINRRYHDELTVKFKNGLPVEVRAKENMRGKGSALVNLFDHDDETCSRLRPLQESDLTPSLIRKKEQWEHDQLMSYIRATLTPAPQIAAPAVEAEQRQPAAKAPEINPAAPETAPPVDGGAAPAR